MAERSARRGGRSARLERGTAAVKLPAGTIPDGPADATLIVACGALAPEILALTAALDAGDRLRLTCLPASVHNAPHEIPEAVRSRIRAGKEKFARVVVGFADCGTGGLLDRVLEDEGVDRIPGPHCYSFFSGAAVFDGMMAAEPGTFFLTDYLARHFDTLCRKAMRLDVPEVRTAMFGHYRKLVHLAQIEDSVADAAARDAADFLGLEHERRFTGFGELAQFMADAAGRPHASET